jgi:peptidoglycan/xylan/chitin deacetylase (PgdA/CDA1 family)
MLKNILSLLYYPFKFYYNEVKNDRIPRLRVLSYHDMEEKCHDLLEEQLTHLTKTWKFLTPDEFELIMHGNKKLTQDSLLLTFDDGTISNYHVACKVLKKLNIKAVFFVVTEYSLLLDTDNWQEFANLNINLKEASFKLNKNFKNMGLKELKYLISNGHTIGGHTNTHKRVSNLSDIELIDEIIKGTDKLELMLDVKIKHFAYPFGNFESLSYSASKIAKNRFHCVYTGMRGDNMKYMNYWNICRESNDPNDLILYTDACLIGCFDILYKKKVEISNSWL